MLIYVLERDVGIQELEKNTIVIYTKDPAILP